jgi:hypothetical protein
MHPVVGWARNVMLQSFEMSTEELREVTEAPALAPVEER